MVAVLVACVALIAPGIATAVYGPAGNPTAGINPGSGPPGTQVAITGANFCPNTQVEISVTPPVGGYPKTVTADGSGNVSDSFIAPGPPGVTYTFTLRSLADEPCSGAPTTDFTVTQPTTTSTETGSGGPVPGESGTTSTSTATTVAGSTGRATSTTVEQQAGFGPVPQLPEPALAAGAQAGANGIPTSGSNAIVQARNALVVVLLGAGLVVVARRRRTARP